MAHCFRRELLAFVEQPSHLGFDVVWERLYHRLTSSSVG
jgi:hypothetical protein